MRMKNVIYRNGIVGERALAQCENAQTTIMYHPRTTLTLSPRLHSAALVMFCANIMTKCSLNYPTEGKITCCIETRIYI